MKKSFLILCILLFSNNFFAQKIINNPDHKGKNFPAEVTKIELTVDETIVHFHMKAPLGYRFSITKLTYIEDSGEKGKRLYVEKSEGILVREWYTISNPDGIRYKLYFPPLAKDALAINYGEANNKGDWYIYKLDLTKNGTKFLNGFNIVKGKPLFNTGDWTVIGRPYSDSIYFNQNQNLAGVKIGRHANIGGDTKLPKDLPKVFFGNWYDKYGTLILITTPDYIVSDFRIQYYQSIQKIGDSKFNISSNMRSFEVLDVDSESMTIRTDRLLTLSRKPSINKAPSFLKGNWLHWGNVKEIKVTDDYFYNNDHGSMGVYEVVSRIDQVIESESGNVIWFVLYHEGNYNLYNARMTNGEYILQPRGFVNARYKKVKN